MISCFIFKDENHGDLKQAARRPFGASRNDTDKMIVILSETKDLKVS